MQSADRFGPLKGLCPYKALIGLTQATGLAGGFDFAGSGSKAGHPEEKKGEKRKKVLTKWERCGILTKLSARTGAEKPEKQMKTSKTFEKT